MSIREFVIVTGLSGSGKTTYCDDQKENILTYDKVFNYKDSTLLFGKIDKIINCTNEKIFLDGYNTELIQYIKNINPNTLFKCIFLYTDLDNYYDILAIKDPRDFISTGDFRYDNYILNAKNSINDLLNTTNNLEILEITYVYRTYDNKYIDYDTDVHLREILNKKKNDIALDFINETSGHSSYQSIILDSEYIKRGTEKDWLSFENILKCTSLKDKVICDTGCFNGYFSFKSVEEGAKKVIGIDHNEPAINICNKLCIWNNYHLWNMGLKNDVSCDGGIDFYLKKIGRDEIFNFEEETSIDVLFALNYLHHLKNELGLDAFLDTLDSFFKNSKEVVFEINEPEIEYIEKIAENNNFILSNKIESHRKTSFGNRWILHYKL